MSTHQRISQLHSAARYAAAQNNPDLAAELRDTAAALEQQADERAGDFGDDGAGDPSLCPVRGWLC
jgi:hypothetical protein